VEKISRIDCAKKYNIELRGKGTSLRNIKLRKDDSIGHILRSNCIIKHVTEGKTEVNIEGTMLRGIRRAHLLDNLKERKIYCKLTEEALDRIQWRTRFGRSCGSAVRQTT
jgi:hypothetical protein